MEHLAWPIVGLILGLVVIFVVRQPFCRFLDRARRITRDGIETDAVPQVSRAEIRPSAMEEFQRFFDNALLVQREIQIRTELERVSFADINERERVLIRLFAASSIIQAFEQTYASIWGSQLGVLQFLNSAGTDGVQSSVLQTWYHQAAAQYPDVYENYLFDQWLGFLETHALILRRETAVFISLEGREFLKYIFHQGYSIYKAG